VSDMNPLEPKPHGKPTAWIVLSAVLAVALLGMAVWAFNAQSDADDAQTKLAAAETQAPPAETPAPEATEPAETPAATEPPEPGETPGATETPAAAETPAAPVEVDSELQQQLEQLANDLGVTNATVEQIQKDLEAAGAKVKAANQERDDAKGALDTARAEAEALQARIELTLTCLKGTLDAVSSAFTSGGVDAAKQELRAIADNCKAATS